MPQDIFNLFANSIETVRVKAADRGTFEFDDTTQPVPLNAIVKRRKGMAEAMNQSEDRDNRTTVHFYPTDAQYIQAGVFVEIDGKWHSIQEVRDGKNFDTGATEFMYVFLDNDETTFDDEPVWGRMPSA